MENPKRHKRSGSTAKGDASHSAGAPRFTKRYMVPRPFGKYQGYKPRNEKKNLDTDIVAAGLTSVPSLASASIQLLNPFNNGSTATTVVGRHCIMKSLLLRMNIIPVFTLSSSPTTVRIVVFYDRQPSGAIPGVAGLFAQFGTASFNNLANSDRFSVLLDEKIPIGGMYITGTPTNVQQNIPKGLYVDRYVKIGLPCEASGAQFTGAIGGIATGALLLCCFSDIAAANNPPTVVSAASRVRYLDA